MRRISRYEIEVWYTNKALLVIVGVRSDGFREILGARIADSGDESTWKDILSDLKERGLSKVDLVFRMAIRGKQAEVECSFPGSSWQMCTVDFIRKVLRKLPKKVHKDIAHLPRESLTPDSVRTPGIGRLHDGIP